MKLIERRGEGLRGRFVVLQPGRVRISGPPAAMALASELGMRPLHAHCHRGLGALYRRTGDGVKAREHLTTATTMYREMAMAFWLAQAEAELKVLD